jgi:predicted MPP superfamily phosphohydrolase
MKRRVFLPMLAAGTAGAVWARYVEPTLFELTRTQIRIPGLRPRRILHVSDIHMSDGMTAAELEGGLVAGLAERPELICLTGDFVSTTSGFDRPGLERLLKRAVDTAPVYAVLGNHDGGYWLSRHGGERSTGQLRELVTGAGVRVLHNESVQAGDLTITGLADLWSGEFDPRRAFSERAEKRLVLCHNPDGKDRLLDQSWDLMLSGHTHGGQARIPGLTPGWAPVIDKRFISGLYRWEGRQLYITRGLGSPNHVRALCRPEVSILEIAG